MCPCIGALYLEGLRFQHLSTVHSKSAASDCVSVLLWDRESFPRDFNPTTNQQIVRLIALLARHVSVPSFLLQSIQTYLEQAKLGQKLTTSSWDGKSPNLFIVTANTLWYIASFVFQHLRHCLFKREKASSPGFEEINELIPWKMDTSWQVIKASPSASCKTQQQLRGGTGRIVCTEARTGGLNERQEIYSLPQSQPQPLHSINTRDRKPLAFPIWKVRRVLKEGQA